MIARTPKPITSVNGLVSFRCAARIAIRCSMAPSGAATPRMPGSWEIRMCAEMPARKPVVTGIESRSAIQPRRKMPANEKQEPDHQRQRSREHQILRVAGGGQCRQASGKDRRDGRIRAARQEAIASEQGECQRAREKGEEADLRGKPAEPGGRHLLGDRDRGERQSREQIVGEELKSVAIAAKTAPARPCPRSRNPERRNCQPSPLPPRTLPSRDQIQRYHAGLPGSNAAPGRPFEVIPQCEIVHVLLIIPGQQSPLSFR